MDYPTFPFHVIIFSINDWLTEGSNMSREECDGVPLTFLFLRTLFPALGIWNTFWFECSMASQGCQHPHLVIKGTCLSWALFESCWIFTHILGPPEFSTQWYLECYLQFRGYLDLCCRSPGLPLDAWGQQSAWLLSRLSQICGRRPSLGLVRA